MAVAYDQVYKNMDHLKAILRAEQERVIAAAGAPGLDTFRGFCHRALAAAGLPFLGSALQYERTQLGLARKELGLVFTGKYDNKRSSAAIPPIGRWLDDETTTGEANVALPPGAGWIPELRQKGLKVLPRCASRAQVAAVRAHVAQQQDQSALSWTKLRLSAGNGRNGAYAYIERNAVLDNITASLTTALGFPDDGLRCIVLRYTEGGVNWWHQDQSSHPFQALLMLSEPSVDFSGGQLVVQSKENLRAAPAVATFTAPGDLAVFAANEIRPPKPKNPFDRPAHGKKARGFVHGMQPVGKGTGAVCERWAIGLLQPKPKATKKATKAKQAKKRKKRKQPVPGKKRRNKRQKGAPPSNK